MSVFEGGSWQVMFLCQVKKRKSIPVMTSLVSHFLIRQLAEIPRHGLVSIQGRHHHSLSVSNSYRIFTRCWEPWKALRQHMGPDTWALHQRYIKYHLNTAWKERMT